MKDWLKRRYGDGDGLLKHWQAIVADKRGKYARYYEVDWDSVTRLVFVCRGNICRSPYAEKVARNMRLPARSIGLGTRAGKRANERAIYYAGARNIDLESHRALPVHGFKFLPGDLALCMEPQQADELLESAVGVTPQVSLLGLWSRRKRPYLHDPYGLEGEYWITCFDVIDSAIATVAQKLGERS